MADDNIGVEEEKHHMMVERLEEVLPGEDDDSIEESDEQYDDIEMFEEVDDSTTLGKIYEGHRKESLS